jgi:IS5 family transposase
VSDSIAWRRFCKIPLDCPAPHPTTLVKLVRRAGPEVIAQLNTALVGKLAEGKLLRGRKLGIDTTVVEADIDDPTDADLLGHAVGKLGGLVRRVRARGVASGVRFRDRRRAAGRRLRQLSQVLRRRGVAMDQIDRLTAALARLARATLRDVDAIGRTARRSVARRPSDGWLRRLTADLDQTVHATQRLLAQTTGATGRPAHHRRPDGLPGRPRRPPDPHRPNSATSCWSPRTRAGSSPTTTWSGATRPTRPNSCPPSSAS